MGHNAPLTLEVCTNFWRNHLIIFDGIAMGMLLFLISVGLSVTLGLMNFVNLAHGAFATLGGYTCVILFGKFGMPFLVCLLMATLVSGIAGVVLERTLYRRLYRSSHLDHVLFSVGLIFVSISTASYFFGASLQSISLPDYLQGNASVIGLEVNKYRLFLTVLAVSIALALEYFVRNTRFGAQLRAAVDNPRTARGLGLEVDRIFTITFAAGSALAGLGGALGLDLLGVDPAYSIKYIVYFLIVVIVGGSGNIRGTLYASVVIGVVDMLGKYYVPELGSFIIYALMMVMLIGRTHGLLPNFSGRSK